MTSASTLTNLQDLLQEAGLLSEEDEGVLTNHLDKVAIKPKFNPIKRSIDKDLKHKKTLELDSTDSQLTQPETEIRQEVPGSSAQVPTPISLIRESSFPLHPHRGLEKKTEAVLTFSDRFLEAFLTIIPVENDPIDKSFMERFLLYRGVKHGIDWKIIEGALQRANDGEIVQDVLIATGEFPRSGRDSVVNTYFEEETKYITKISLRPDQGFDTSRRYWINSVTKGQLIAEKIAAISGQDGRNVRGEIIYSRRSRDLPLSAGKNTVMNKAGELFSKIDGRPVIDEFGRVSVIQSYTVEGDLDINLGNVEFGGDVEILGSVRSGLSIKAGGGILVRESVESARLIAEEDITVKGAYSGGIKGLIQSGGSVSLAHVNTGQLEIVGDLRVSKELINAQAIIGGSLNFPRGKGTIKGGTLYVRGNLEVFNLGSELGVPTHIYLGPYEICKSRLREVQLELRQNSDSLDVLENALQRLDAGDGDPRISRKQLAETRDKLNAAINALEVAKNLLIEEIEQLEVMMEKYHSCFLRVEGRVFPGVHLHIGRADLEINREMKRVEFFLNPGSKEIKSRPYEPKKKKEFNL